MTFAIFSTSTDPNERINLAAIDYFSGSADGRRETIHYQGEGKDHQGWRIAHHSVDDVVSVLRECGLLVHFKELTQLDNGRRNWVNPIHIASYEPGDERGTHIRMPTGEFNVRESPETIDDLSPQRVVRIGAVRAATPAA